MHSNIKVNLKRESPKDRNPERKIGVIRIELDIQSLLSKVLARCLLQTFMLRERCFDIRLTLYLFKFPQHAHRTCPRSLTVYLVRLLRELHPVVRNSRIGPPFPQHSRVLRAQCYRTFDSTDIQSDPRWNWTIPDPGLFMNVIGYDTQSPIPFLFF